MRVVLVAFRLFFAAWLVVPVSSLAFPAAAAAASSVDGGGWRWPLEPQPRIIRPFDPPARPWLPGHRGLDLAAVSGETVYAAGAGKVGFAGMLAGRGVVTVLHGEGLRTTYLPVRPSVRRGESVAAGDVIGVVQDAPRHCPVVCLHWGLLRDGRYLDPLLLLGISRIRLLPFWADPPPPLTTAQLTTAQPPSPLFAVTRPTSPPFAVTRPIPPTSKAHRSTIPNSALRERQTWIAFVAPLSAVGTAGVLPVALLATALRRRRTRQVRPVRPDRSV